MAVLKDGKLVQSVGYEADDVEVLSHMLCEFFNEGEDDDYELIDVKYAISQEGKHSALIYYKCIK